MAEAWTSLYLSVQWNFKGIPWLIIMYIVFWWTWGTVRPTLSRRSSVFSEPCRMDSCQFRITEIITEASLYYINCILLLVLCIQYNPQNFPELKTPGIDKGKNVGYKDVWTVRNILCILMTDNPKCRVEL